MNASAPSFAARLTASMTSVAAVALAVSTLDAVGASGDIGLAARIGVFAYMLGLCGVALLPLGLMTAILGAVAKVDTLGSPRHWCAAFGSVGALIAISYEVNVWTRSAFHNVELASLLAAVAASASAVALVAAGAATVRSARSPAADRAVAAGWTLIGIGAACFVLAENESGLSQLSGWLLAMPLATSAIAIAALLARRRLLGLGPAGLIGPIVIATSFAGVIVAEARDMTVGDLIAAHAPLGRWIAPVIHRATDFDEDGFSGLMGGGDCEPWDSAIAPGKFDVPGDGIDNNCVGGDAAPWTAAQRPVWFEHAPPVEPLDVVLVTVETLRADHVGFLGYDRDTTPNLDAIAESAVVFDQFFAASTFTRLSLPSLLSSRLPSRIEWQKQDASSFPRIDADNPWLPAAFKRAGFTTAAFTGDFPAFTDEDAIGFSRGFHDYDATTPIRYRGGTMRGFPALQQVEKVTRWLDRRDADQRLFVWIHMFEPHFRYERRDDAPDWGNSSIARYDAEIWAVDQAIGDIVHHLEAAGRWDRTILVVLGDHGEEFGEHGERFHGSNLHGEQVRVPLLIRVPGLPARQISTPASMVDLASTILNLTGLPDEFARFEGRNLSPELRGAEVDEATIFSEVWNMKSRGSYQVAAVQWPHKMIASGTSGRHEELYDLATDPAERHNIIEEDPVAAERLREVVHTFLDGTMLRYH